MTDTNAADVAGSAQSDSGASDRRRDVPPAAAARTDLRRLDFMLLLVLTEAVRRRKLTEVARTLGVTQAAVSHAVARLRDLFGDELFLRRPQGVEPTARALELAEQAELVLGGAAQLLAAPEPFDPARLFRTVRVVALDYAAALLVDVLEELRAEAPGLSLAVRAPTAGGALLERGEVDLALGSGPGRSDRLRVDFLCRERYLTIARADHPALGAGVRLDLDAFCRLPHAMVSPGGAMRGAVDRALARLGRSRRVILAASNFLSVLDAVGRTDLIATVPARLAQQQAARFGLVIHEPPLDLPGFPVSVARHRRSDGDAALDFIVRHLQAALGGDPRANHPASAPNDRPFT